jgi:hypothetical protein
MASTCPRKSAAAAVLRRHVFPVNHALRSANVARSRGLNAESAGRNARILVNKNARPTIARKRASQLARSSAGRSVLMNVSLIVRILAKLMTAGRNVKSSAQKSVQLLIWPIGDPIPHVGQALHHQKMTRPLTIHLRRRRLDANLMTAVTTSPER